MDVEEEVPDVLDAPAPSFEREGSFFGRLLRELGDGFRPRTTAAGFARDDQRRGPWTFFLLTFVPFAMLSGVIPFTHTLRFGDVFGIEVIGDPHRTDITFDVLRAMGLALVIQGAQLIAFAAAFRSLAGAYGNAPEGAVTDDVRRIATRAILYRAWWFPMQGILGLPVALAMWGLPKLEDSPLSGFALLALLIVSVAPLVYHFVGMRHAAKRACGAGPLASFAVVLVPYLLVMVVQHVLVGDPTTTGLLSDWIPQPSE
ncbi:MAG: hypothetical protein AAGE52_22240 [Myxococcota bacterium]